MAKKSANLTEKIQISADVINRYVAEILNSQDYALINREHNEGFITQFNLIKSSFQRVAEKDLRKVDVATRLSLIDLFYTTNFNRFAEFGLEELTEKLWDLCSDAKGHHLDSILVKKVEAFVRDCNNAPLKASKSEIFINLFAPTAKFGITKVETEFGIKAVGYSAQSLISKYLFFLLESFHSEGNFLGFPIYDSIALDLQAPLMKKLCAVKACERDMVEYVANMTAILNCLKNSSDANRFVWDMPQTVCNTQFGLLDYFLWRIGKSGKFSFSLLWTKDEKRKHYVSANLLKNKTSRDIQKDFQSLPLRFKHWYSLYVSIKE